MNNDLFDLWQVYVLTLLGQYCNTSPIRAYLSCRSGAVRSIPLPFSLKCLGLRSCIRRLTISSATGRGHTQTAPSHTQGFSKIQSAALGSIDGTRSFWPALWQGAGERNQRSCKEKVLVSIEAKEEHRMRFINLSKILVVLYGLIGDIDADYAVHAPKTNTDTCRTIRPTTSPQSSILSSSLLSPPSVSYFVDHQSRRW